jgi:hypothetical protein
MCLKLLPCHSAWPSTEQLVLLLLGHLEQNLKDASVNTLTHLLVSVAHILLGLHLGAYHVIYIPPTGG